MQVVTHNLVAQNADRNLKITGLEKSKTVEKLSSGYRINRAADDAAGLTISEKMRWQIKGLDKASNNAADGYSLLQVADGALDEVHDMLHRMKELAIQAANDTNTEEDREAIQEEIDSLISEIDRIGDTTEFNTRKLFKGGSEQITTSNGTPISLQNIPFANFNLVDVNLSNQPFTSSSSGGTLNLGAVLGEGYSASGTRWGLVFGSGGTSHSNFRIHYTDDSNVDHTESIMFERMTVNSLGRVEENGESYYKREFTHDFSDGRSVKITQTIRLADNSATADPVTDKQYKFNYEVENTGPDGADFTYELLFNVDTAYNNNDSCEEYYMNNARVDNFSLYTRNPTYLTQGQNNDDVYNLNDHSEARDFSIYNSADYHLPFSEYISIPEQYENGQGLESILIGSYGAQTGNWDNLDNLRCGIGSNTHNRDIAFSIVWTGSVQAGDTGNTSSHAFDYGIREAQSDPNVSGVPVTGSPSSEIHVENLDLWIQSGALDKSGFFITVGEMNSEVLGLSGLNVTSFANASDAIDKIDKATEKISSQRTLIGVQENRLEYVQKVDDNTSENTQAAESKLRDTDMAKEMVNLSKHNILEQTGQSMLTQANQMTQGTLSILPS